jgi:neutral trehalase
LFHPEEVIERFEQRFPTDKNITREALQDFVESNFGTEGTELEECELTDWTERPKLLSDIKDPKLKDFAFALNGIWRRLCRQMKLEVKENEDHHSLIYVPNKFVVPGGRFREL